MNLATSYEMFTKIKLREHFFTKSISKQKCLHKEGYMNRLHRNFRIALLTTFLRQNSEEIRNFLQRYKKLLARLNSSQSIFCSKKILNKLFNKFHLSCPILEFDFFFLEKEWADYIKISSVRWNLWLTNCKKH